MLCVLRGSLRMAFKGALTSGGTCVMPTVAEVLCCGELAQNGLLDASGHCQGQGVYRPHLAGAWPRVGPL